MQTDSQQSEPLDEERPLNYSFWAGSVILRGSILPRVILDVLKFGLIAGVIAVIALGRGGLHRGDGRSTGVEGASHRDGA